MTATRRKLLTVGGLLVAAGAMTVVIALVLGARRSRVAASTLAFRFDTPFATRDSDGVEIAESAAPVWDSARSWRLDSEPTLTIGGIGGDDAYLFQDIRSAHLLPDGSVVVAEGSDRTVRRFDAQGHHLWTESRRGRGPGEFECLGGIILENESILAWPCESAGTSAKFGFDGLLLDAPTTRVRMYGRIVGAYLNADLLVEQDFNNPYVPVGDRRVRVDATYIRAQSDGQRDTLLVFPYLEAGLVRGTKRPMALPFGPKSIAFLYRDTLYIGFNERFEIRVYDGNGNLKRVVRRALEPEVLDRRALDALLADWANEESEKARKAGATGVFMRGLVRASLTAMRHMLVFPDYMPAYSQIRVDDNGDMWVRLDVDRRVVLPGMNQDQRQSQRPYRRGEPGHWSVFDPRGRWLGEVVTPPSVQVLEIGDDYVLGVRTDSLNIPFVVKYRLNKPAGLGDAS